MRPTYSPVADVEIPTDELYIDLVVDRTTGCDIHDAGRYDYCYDVPGATDENNRVQGICNDRAKKAGMVGQIRYASLVRTSQPRHPENG